MATAERPEHEKFGMTESQYTNLMSGLSSRGRRLFLTAALALDKLESQHDSGQITLAECLKQGANIAVKLLHDLLADRAGAIANVSN